MTTTPKYGWDKGVGTDIARDYLKTGLAGTLDSIDSVVGREHNVDGSHVPGVGSSILSWISVKAAPYNAAGNGTTDDTAAINAAIDAAETAGGGVVYFPRGTYKVSNLAAQGYCLRVQGSNITLAGDGPGKSVIQAATNTNQPVIAFYPTSGTLLNVGIRDLEIDGNGANQSFHVPKGGATPSNPGTGLAATWSVPGVIFNEVSGASAVNCKIHDTPNTGLSFLRADDVLAFNNTVKHCGMLRSRQDATYSEPCNSIDVYIKPTDATYPGRGFRIVANNVIEITDLGIGVEGSGISNYAVVGNTVRAGSSGQVNGAAGWGISAEVEPLDSADNVMGAISGNVVDGVIYGIIFCNTQSPTYTAAGWSISGNTVTNCAVGIGIEGRQITVSGNSILNCGTGISSKNNAYTTDCKDWTITGNTITTTGTVYSPGIHLKAGSGITLDTVTIEGNIVRGPGSGDGSCNGVHIDASGGIIRHVRLGANQIINFGYDGIQIKASSGGTIADVKLVGVSTWGNLAYGLEVQGGASVTDVRAEACDFAGNTGAVSGISSGAAATPYKIA